jgi:hypothetical protein
MYYDKFGPGSVQKIDFGYGRVSPRSMGIQSTPKRKSESDFPKRRKKIPQNFYPKRVFEERIDKSSLFLYNEFRISI